jgi:asparagine synthetase B (glutamine-hydrolysing)
LPHIFKKNKTYSYLLASDDIKKFKPIKYYMCYNGEINNFEILKSTKQNFKTGEIVENHWV